MASSETLTLSPKGKIGPIEIQAIFEEVLSDSLQVTEHPVEIGASITDHAYMRPSEVVLRCGWSNSSLNSVNGSATAASYGGYGVKDDYIGGIYSQLQALQRSRERFDIVTSKRLYKDMLITAMQVTTDHRTNNALMVAITCRQIFVVGTRATSLPGMADQRMPEVTAESQNRGVIQPTLATPSPGGAVDPSEW